MEGTVLKSIRLGIARVCLVVLATLYLAGGVAAVLRRNNARGRLLGTAFAVLVALDILGDFIASALLGSILRTLSRPQCRGYCWSL